MATSRRLAAGDPALLKALSGEAQRHQAWHDEAMAEIDRLRHTGHPPTLPQLIADEALMNRFVAGNATYPGQLAERRGSALNRAGGIAVGLVAGLSLALVALGGLAVGRGVSRERRRARRAQELREMLQVSRSADEARRLLIHHVERMLTGSAAVVLAQRGEEESARLGPTLTDTGDPGALRGVQTGNLTSHSCMAMRLSRPYDGAGEDSPLTPCEVCGEVKSTVACAPLLVGRHVIGSVLVGRDRRIPAGARSAIQEAVAQAAPILANLRNLELAEQRAVSDALTGLAVLVVELLEAVEVGALTASFGVAGLPEDAVEPAQLLRCADRALHAARPTVATGWRAPSPAGSVEWAGCPAASGPRDQVG